MAHSFWRGEFVVFKRSDETADVYFWDAPTGSYKWHSDWDSPEQAHRYIEEVEALRPFPEIKSIGTPVAQFTNRGGARLGEAMLGKARHGEARRGEARQGKLR